LIVRFVGYGRASTGQRRDSGFLTVGRQYVVLAVTVSERTGVEFLLLDDDAQQPGSHGAGGFDLLSDRVPSSWRIAVGVSGSASSIDLLPESWMRPPLLPHDVDGYAELAARCPWQRWSCGEHVYTKWEFKQLLDRRAVDILQPDVNRAGGLTESLKICALAEAAGLPVVPHSNEAHNLHLVFSRAPSVCPVVEYFPDAEPDTGNELFWKLFRGNPRAGDGMLAPPTAPGLGVQVDEALLAELQVGPVWHSKASGGMQ